MSAKKPAGANKNITVVLGDPNDQQGKLKSLGGSKSDKWNKNLVDQATNTLWLKHSDEAELERQAGVAVMALAGIAPKDELEGMIGAQLIAAHSAAMECFRRAMIPEQSFEGRRENLNQANKLSRTYSVLLETLNRYRGKGQQKVTVEHVHVHAGGQAVVGTVEGHWGGEAQKSEEQPHAKQIAHAPQPSLWSEDKGQEPVPVAGDAERSLPHARRQINRSAKG
jgi:hypothetical protein